MTKEELRQEAEAEADKVIIGSGMDRTSVIHLKHLLVTMYIQGATKVTKELEAQIEKMKWHYLVENPKDLPKKEGAYWVCVRDGRYKEDGSWEWTSKPLCQTAVWLDGVFGYAGGSPVIGWCELPKWEIKEK